MSATPEIVVDEELVLKPAASGVLVSMFEAYQEDAEAAQTALPWLDPNDDVRRQLRDMLYDIESQRGTDKLHFGPFIPAKMTLLSGWLALVTNCNPGMRTSISVTG